LFFFLPLSLCSLRPFMFFSFRLSPFHPFWVISLFL
jgi:hypothetical protein